jgi:hypothetical protein
MSAVVVVSFCRDLYSRRHSSRWRLCFLAFVCLGSGGRRGRRGRVNPAAVDEGKQIITAVSNFPPDECVRWPLAASAPLGHCSVIPQAQDLGCLWFA